MMTTLSAASAAVLLLGATGCMASTVKVYPAPAGEPLSTDFTVRVEGKDVPVYITRVAPEDKTLRWKAMDDKANSAQYFENASFAYFDMTGSAGVVVRCPAPVTSVRLLPSSLKLRAAVSGNEISFTLRRPRPITVEVNGDWVHSLHLFANPPERDIPDAADPNVIYFGPGIHEVKRMVVESGKTVYLAGGAIVRAVVGEDEPFHISSYSGLRNYSPTFELRGRSITFRGRGILDGSGCPTHARNLVYVHGSDIKIEGVILRDSSTWNLPIRQSDRVGVRNVKVLGYRANSDGIDICNSRDVTVEDCFLRTLDDLIVVKTDRGQGEARRIVARRCVLWNEVAHALSVGAELRENVDDVLFTDCDVIRDKGREWTLRVYHCDAARITNVRFENLRIEESPRLISLWINKAFWSLDEKRGHIDGVTLRGIEALAEPLAVELLGYDSEHTISNVQFDRVRVNGRDLRRSDIRMNEHVRNIEVRP